MRKQCHTLIGHDVQLGECIHDRFVQFPIHRRSRRQRDNAADIGAQLEGESATRVHTATSHESRRSHRDSDLPPQRDNTQSDRRMVRRRHRLSRLQVFRHVRRVLVGERADLHQFGSIFLHHISTLLSTSTTASATNAPFRVDCRRR